MAMPVVKAMSGTVAVAVAVGFSGCWVIRHRRRDGKFHLMRHREAVLFELSAEHIVLTLQALVVVHLITAVTAAVHIHPKEARPAKIDKKACNKDTDGKCRDERHKTLYKIHNVHS